MIIGIPREIKQNENRVAITPGGVAELVKSGHVVFVEKDAGAGSHIKDSQFHDAGAQIIKKAQDVYGADFVIKVKEPIKEEYQLLHKDQILFCFLHLAPNKELTDALIKAKVIAIGYETVETADGHTPLLAPMSEVAGRLAPQVGAHSLEAINGGRGVLLGGVAGVAPAKVAVIGGGIVGSNAALIAVGMGANVTIIDKNLNRLRYLEEVLTGKISTMASNPINIARVSQESDLVIGAAYIPGAQAPKLVTEDMVKNMLGGAVVVDVAIDQGGSIETAKPTTHDKPIYEKHGVIHYAVTNIPSAVPHTSTHALTNATLPWVLEIANKGWQKATEDHLELAKGLNVVKGQVVHKAVAKAQNC